MKLCPRCKEEKSLEQFSKNKLREDGLQRMCKQCSKEAHKKFWVKNGIKKREQRKEFNNLFKEKIRNIKEQSKCAKCKEERWWVLEFHHKDPLQKEFNIGDGIIVGQKRVLKEIEKCVVLCSNCHNDFHYKEKQENITIEKYLEVSSEIGIGPVLKTG